MAAAGLSPDVLIAKIRGSRCDFDTSPAALTDLKSKGIADPVLLAMIAASNNPSRDPSAVEPSSDAESRTHAVRSLRKLANAVEVGVSYDNYSPLVVEAKTEIDSVLPAILPEGQKSYPPVASQGSVVSSQDYSSFLSSR
jgi:hypothetical protein